MLRDIERIRPSLRDIEDMERAADAALESALVVFRRTHPAHGLSQLALADLEFARAAADWEERRSEHDAAFASEPPETEGPEWTRARAAAERASSRLRGEWRAWALYMLGYLLQERHEVERARAAFARGIEEPMTPAHADMAFRIAEMDFDAGRWGSAARLYQQVMDWSRTQPVRALARYKLAWTHLRAERWTDARDGALALLDAEGQIGVEARTVILPLALTGARDFRGTSLGAESPVHRVTALHALSRHLADLGDRTAAGVAIDAALALCPGAGPVCVEVQAHRRLLDRPASSIAPRARPPWVSTT